MCILPIISIRVFVFELALPQIAIMRFYAVRKHAELSDFCSQISRILQKILAGYMCVCIYVHICMELSTFLIRTHLCLNSETRTQE